ncbi:MAG TPA: efflux RND transporter permease subunit [Terriglobales bacterium]|nr:efflux RND transporter permease subunit [Terriglobales bacterium]
MWIVALALRRPYTFVVMALLILILSPIVIERTPTDIFPNIDIPVISVVWRYQGLSPQEMANRITTQTERGLTTLVNDIEHIESQSLNGTAVVKIFFQPTANIQTALAQVTAISQTALRQLPPGATAPLIIQYSASTVPILQIGMSSRSLSEQQLNDLALNFLRTQLITVPGAAIPYPYGGKQRLVSVDLNVPALQAKHLTPVDVVNAIGEQNLILPSGTAKIGPLEYQVELNASPLEVSELNDLPIKTVNGTTIYIRDVAHVRDGFSPQTNIVHQDGVRGTLLSILKNGNASTTSVVKAVQKMLPRIQATLPNGLEIKQLFDQSLFVRAAIQGVLREALIGACLTALMILLFLGNWRSTLIIATSIPLSILTSVLLLSALGETFNIMTLGGLALAVGILVDDATVEIENIQRNLHMGKELKQAILDGAQQIAVPAFVSTLSICIVFVPMFFLTGVARYLFVPLAEAVVFAMLASYLLSRTLVPTMAMYLMTHHEHDADKPKRSKLGHFQERFERRFEQLRDSYRNLMESVMHHRGAFVSVFLLFCVLSCGLVFFLGRDFFPSVDAGQFRLHVRGRAGLRIEETARLVDLVEQEIRREVPRDQISTVLDNIGLPYSGINTSYSNSGTIGTSDAEILVSLNKDHRPTEDYIHELRENLPRNFPGVEFFFQPADIVSQILNFGLPAPVDIQLVGRDYEENYYTAQRIANRLRHIPGAVDVHVQQMMNLPTLHLDVDRVRAQQVGISEQDVAQNLLVSLSSSFQTTPSYWLNPKNGVTYDVAVMSPQYRVDSMQALMNTPVSNGNSSPQLLANLANVKPEMSPAVVNHYNVTPVVDVYASVDSRDLGGVADDIDKAIAPFRKHLPRGTDLQISGQVETMKSSFSGLSFGLVMSVVLVYLLIVVNFQSWLDPFIIISALPGALAGIVWTLFVTRTTLSVPALTGAVMSIGVATANSILLISFARERMDEGMDPIRAAVEAGYTRMRPVIMTALAMIIGMVPLALGLGEGGEQNAPLGRAVIGGLLFATVATLFFVPVVFSIFHGRRLKRASLAREQTSKL